MIYPIEINTVDAYNVVTSIGFNPLIDWRRFIIAIDLRISIQRQLFGHSVFGPGRIPQANQKFYEYCWDNAPIHNCEECTRKLERYSAIYISHILSRGGYPEMAHDPRNHNLLCGKCHQRWEDPDAKIEMKIFRQNQIVIQLLKNDYHARFKSMYIYRKHG